VNAMVTPILIVGIGNEYRSDDAAGILVARAIEGENLPGVSVIEQSGDGAALMDRWKEAESVFLVDAVSSGAPPGTVYRIDARTEQLPEYLLPFSTHAFGVAQAVELARSMNNLPPKLIIFGIEGKDFDSGVNVSGQVMYSTRKVTQALLDEISSTVGQELL